MKIFCLGSLAYSVAQLVDDNETEFRRRTNSLERRYNQLMSQINFYDPDFDPRKYWGYGCNCFGLGDRPMSEGLNNIAVDELDASCKKYKGKQSVFRRVFENVNLKSFSLTNMRRSLKFCV